mgnify:CR=1 FL=1
MVESKFKVGDMVVDIKRCIEEKISIWCTTSEQSQQIWTDFYKYKKQKPRCDSWNVSYKNGFEICLFCSNCPAWQPGYNRTYFIDKYKASKCLDYNDVLLKEKTLELW